MDPWLLLYREGLVKVAEMEHVTSEVPKPPYTEVDKMPWEAL
jgi:hypothetical protein